MIQEEAGYQLGTADGKAPELTDDGHGLWGGLDKSVMEYIVRATYNEAAIRETNANLAATVSNPHLILTVLTQSSYPNPHLILT